MNADGLVNYADRDIWVNNLKGTFFGDATLDGEFDSGDFVAAFNDGGYELGPRAAAAVRCILLLLVVANKRL